ncbi:MAG: DNA polymerase III subunit beta [Bordetella sp.]|nr:MAG: DNA polymerase III subunit beta [Bordetella sp.]
MQLVQTNRDILLKPLATVVGIIERRHVIPILANVLIKKEKNRVSFFATDLEIQITTYGDFGIGSNDESITVAGRKFLDILKTFPDSEKINLFLINSNKLSIQLAKSHFSLQTLPANDFPLMSEPSKWDVSLKISQKNLKYLFGMVHFAMAHQDIRYYLNGMLIEFESNYMRAVATDGHRLAHYAIEIENISIPKQIIIPRKTILEIQRLLMDSDEPVLINVSTNQIRFCFRNILLVSKLVEGKFPDFRKVIPTNYTRHFSISRDILQKGLSRVAILTNDKFKGIRFQLEKNLLKISSVNSEQEEAKEEIDIDYVYEPLDVGFNVNYLLDVLINLKTFTIDWSIEPNKNSSTLITIPGNKNFKYVVMPMRI